MCLPVPKEKNIFHTHCNFTRLTCMLVGHWPYQKKLYKHVLRICQAICSCLIINGQVRIQLIFTIVMDFITVKV